MRSRVYFTLRLALALVGLAFIGAALASALRDPTLSVLPSATSFLAAVTMVVVGLWAAVAGWARLLGSPITPNVARGFLLAQLGKYVPGGIWQIVGQVGHATSTIDVGGRRATLAYLVSVVVQITAGLVVGLPIVALSEAPGWIRGTVAAAAVVMVALIVEYRLLRRILLALPWIRSAGQDRDELMPPRSALLYACGTSSIAMLAAGAVFVVAYRAPAGSYLVETAPAYALAWTIGFLAVPFPAGLGIREAALLLLIPGGSSTAIVAASAIVRVIYIVGELVAIGTAMLPGRLSQSWSTDVRLDEVDQRAGGSDAEASDQ